MPKALAPIIRSLKHRNFKLFFAGQLFSLVGTWTSSIATGWLVYRLTGSAFLLASVSAVSMTPFLVLSPLAGVQIDRWNRRKVLLITQLISMAQSFALAGLTLSGLITVPQLFLLVAIQGVVNCYDIPARQTLLSEIVPNPADLSNAIALNSAMFNGARLVGPALGGAIISVSNEGFCYLIDGFSYLAVIAALLAMKIPRQTFEHVPKAVSLELREGLRYAFGFAPIGALLTLVAVVSFAMTPHSTLLPAFARDVLNADAGLLGQLMATSGLGALTGALYLASRRSVLGLGRVVTSAGFLLGTSIVLFPLCQDYRHAAPLLFLIGLSTILLFASCNTLLQTIVEKEMRGRVVSLYTMGFIGATPLGSVAAGWGATLFGLRATIMTGGIMVICVTAWFRTLLPKLRELTKPIYVSKGILSAAGTEMDPPEGAPHQVVAGSV